ncbi:uncharacterized protein C8A04DRAFT_37806 [Dichotomopilus funicola]|uniref:Uncharacterized protein n=1 Tax=Dichotomopilus funicola TaxID=1934379 RepID=A0AAN6V264_9PEZI|nr:hypothetical protein C8A04DRAFT_37806 [Dichotomopilus funicola]
MTKSTSRATFDRLLAAVHVQHALVRPDGTHNELPSALATLLFLGRTPEQLQTVNNSLASGLVPWTPSPRAVHDDEDKTRLLGDIRFQRAFMSYFSLENGNFGGDTRALAIHHIFSGNYSGSEPLLYGLFSGVGRPLSLLADGIELQATILVMESLTLSAVHWMERFGDLLTAPETPEPSTNYLSPEDILGRAGHDGRFSGVMKTGPGFHGVSYVFTHPGAQAAIMEYMQYLDTRDVMLLVQQISALSVLLLSATHKPKQPAFDLYLARLPTCVYSTRVLLTTWVVDQEQQLLLVRSLWLLVVLTYVTQLRPIIDGKLMVSEELACENATWEGVFGEPENGAGSAGAGGEIGDVDLLRALRSLRELSRVYEGVHGKLYLHAAWKMRKQWAGWTGRGTDREAVLNIRL